MGNTSSMYMCCLNKKYGRHHNEEIEGIDGLSRRRPQKQYNTQDIEAQVAKNNRQYCFIFGGAYDANAAGDFGWDDGSGDDEFIDEEMGAQSEQIYQKHPPKQERKGKYPGDYCQWIEEPTYGGFDNNDNKQWPTSTPPHQGIKASRSVKGFTPKVDLRSAKQAQKYQLDESIITINNDGFHANIMREDMKSIQQKQGNNYFVNFDDSVMADQQSTTLTTTTPMDESKTLECEINQDQIAMGASGLTKKSTEGQIEETEGQDKSPETSDAQINDACISQPIVKEPIVISEKPKAEKPKVITSYGDDMTNWIWEGPDDSDEEIDELIPYKNQYEKQQGIKFSKNGLVNYIENMLELESPVNKKNAKNAKLWEKSLTQQGINLFIKKGGSKFSKDQPFIRIESTFNKKFKLDKLLNFIQQPEHLSKWDDTVLSNDIKPVGDRKSLTVTFVHLVHKKQFSFQSRDFVDKSFNFYHNGKFYRYTSAMPEEQSSSLYPCQKDTVRGFNYFNLGIYERETDGKIKGTFTGQFDFKIPIPPFMINSFLPNTTKNWYSSVTKYYMKNNKK